MNDIQCLLLIIGLLNWVEINNPNAIQFAKLAMNFITIDPPISNLLKYSKKESNGSILLNNLNWRDFRQICLWIQTINKVDQLKLDLQQEEIKMVERANELFNWSKRFK